MEEEVRIFLLEAYENLDRVEQVLLELEKKVDVDLIHDVFRAIHTIKGNSGFLGYSKLEQLCHRGETLLDQLRNGHLALTPQLANILLELVDTTREILKTIEQTGSDGDEDVSALLDQLASHHA